MTEISKYRRIEMSADNVVMCIEKADHWTDAEITICCEGSGKARLKPCDIDSLKALIKEYEDNYKGNGE